MTFKVFNGDFFAVNCIQAAVVAITFLFPIFLTTKYHREKTNYVGEPRWSNPCRSSTYEVVT